MLKRSSSPLVKTNNDLCLGKRRLGALTTGGLRHLGGAARGCDPAGGLSSLGPEEADPAVPGQEDVSLRALSRFLQGSERLQREDKISVQNENDGEF